MHKAERPVKNLGLLVGITSLKAVMDVTEELFHLSKKSGRGNDTMFWHPSVFSVAIVWGRVVYLHFQVGKQDTALCGHMPVSLRQASRFAWHLGKNCSEACNRCANLEIVTS